MQQVNIIYKVFICKGLDMYLIVKKGINFTYLKKKILFHCLLFKFLINIINKNSKNELDIRPLFSF